MFCTDEDEDGWMYGYRGFPRGLAGGIYMNTLHELNPYVHSSEFEPLSVSLKLQVVSLTGESPE
jgi:hypothetical protein